MKFVVDAMCAEFGGIRTYVDQLLKTWATSFPDDELHVAVPCGSSVAAGSGHVRHELTVRRPAALGRPVAQSTAMRRLIADTSPAAVLATLPSTTLRRAGCPLVVVVHDLRHDLRPEQFSRARRAMRWMSYGRGYGLADGFIAISARTQADLHAVHPSTRDRPIEIVYHGADHVTAWPTADRQGAAVAFAHHANKNPRLLIEAWSTLARQGHHAPLTILGVGAREREALESQIVRSGVRDLVTLAPFLPEEDFRRVIASADMIVFPSDFEGFGLPIVEGMALGKPVVIGPETATLEVSAGHAHVMADWTPGALADAVLTARTMDEPALAAARAWGQTFTWDRAVTQTRSMMLALAG